METIYGDSPNLALKTAAIIVATVDNLATLVAVFGDYAYIVAKIGDYIVAVWTGL